MFLEHVSAKGLHIPTINEDMPSKLLKQKQPVNVTTSHTNSGIIKKHKQIKWSMNTNIGNKT